MPSGLTAPLTGASFSTMGVDELCDRHRELLQRTREVDHWLRLIGARLDLAVAAVADLPEPVPDPAPLISALAAELGGPGTIRAAITASHSPLGAGFAGPAGGTELAALLGRLEGASFAGATELPGGFEAFDAEQNGAGDAGSDGLAQIPVRFPPDGLRDLLGIARSEDRLVDAALLPQLREAAGQLAAYGEALRNLTEEAAHVIAVRLGTQQLPA
jgi:hypothetical protein